MNGHWFCLHCDDVTFLPAPVGRSDGCVKCPNCGHKTAAWITSPPPRHGVKPPIKPVSPDLARLLFNHIRETLNHL